MNRKTNISLEQITNKLASEFNIDNYFDTTSRLQPVLIEDRIFIEATDSNIILLLKPLSSL